MAVPSVWLATALSTWGRASSAFFTVISQWGHIIPSTFITFVIAEFSFSIGSAASTTGCLIFLSRLGEYSLKRFNRRALVTTQKLDRLMAAAPNIGFKVQPKMGIHTPAAKGIPITL